MTSKKVLEISLNFLIDLFNFYFISLYYRAYFVVQLIEIRIVLQQRFWRKTQFQEKMKSIFPQLNA